MNAPAASASPNTQPESDSEGTAEKNAPIVQPTARPAIIVSFSDEGDSFKHEKKISLSDGGNFGKNNRKVVDMNSLNSSARFVRVQAINRKTCPDWHDAAGGKAWIFADEIVIR